MHVDLFLLIVVAICFASTAMQGGWTNAITLINVMFAALIATNYWEPLASSLDGWDHRYTYIWDMLAVWGLFGAAFLILRAFTDTLSKVKVRFIRKVDVIGGILLSTWTTWIMVCFATMTLHLAPLAPDFMNGSFQPQPKSSMFLGMAPDRQWLALVQKISGGSLGRSVENEFDPQAEFIPKYRFRRSGLQELEGLTLQ
jgi:hypothetical protein